MKKWIFVVFALAFVTVSLLGAVEDSGYSGLWEAEYVAKDQTLQMQFYRKGNNNGFRVAIEAFRGLTLEIILSDSRSVLFQLVREAGIFECKGSFKSGYGRGEYEFQADKTFVSKMSDLGYPGMSSKKQYEMAMLDVNTKFIRDLRELGYRGLDLDQFIEMKIHGASAEYARAMASLGYKDIAADK
ncbi:hypothetical protein L0222_00390, partial [bacterium]|nr:hypothetical protein [bacterium]